MIYSGTGTFMPMSPFPKKYYLSNFIYGIESDEVFGKYRKSGIRILQFANEYIGYLPKVGGRLL